MHQDFSKCCEIGSMRIDLAYFCRWSDKVLVIVWGDGERAISEKHCGILLDVFFCDLVPGCNARANVHVVATRAVSPM